MAFASHATNEELFSTLVSNAFGDFFVDWEYAVEPAVQQMRDSGKVNAFVARPNEETFNSLREEWISAVEANGMHDDVEGVEFTPTFCALLNCSVLPTYNPTHIGYGESNDVGLAQSIHHLTPSLLRSIALVPRERFARFVTMKDFVLALRALVAVDAEAIAEAIAEADGEWE